MTRRGQILGSLGLAAATFALGLAGLEGALRLLPGHDNLYATATLDIYAPDAELGWTLRPDVRREVPWLRRVITIRTDAWGRRTPSHAAVVDPDGSLVFAGDSYTFGNEVDAEETFAFRTGAAVGVSVVNLGVGGYSLDQTCRSLGRYLAHGRAAHAFLAIFVGNDIEYGAALDQVYTVSTNGNLVHVGSAGGLREVISRSRVGLLALKAADVARARWMHRRSTHTTSSYRWIYDEAAWVQGSLESHSRSLSKALAAAHKAQVPLTVLLLPEWGQVYGPLSDLPNRQVASEVVRLGIPVLDLLPTLRDKARSDSSLYNPGVAGHLSPSGHDAVVTVLVDYLRNRGRTRHAAGNEDAVPMAHLQ